MALPLEGARKHSFFLLTEEERRREKKREESRVERQNKEGKKRMGAVSFLFFLKKIEISFFNINN